MEKYRQNMQDLQPDFKAVLHKAAADIGTMSVRPSVTLCVSLCRLYGMNKICFIHFARVDSEPLCLVFNLGHTQTFICDFRCRHRFISFCCSRQVWNPNWFSVSILFGIGWYFFNWTNLYTSQRTLPPDIFNYFGKDPQEKYSEIIIFFTFLYAMFKSNTFNLITLNFIGFIWMWILGQVRFVTHVGLVVMFCWKWSDSSK